MVAESRRTADQHIYKPSVILNCKVKAKCKHWAGRKSEPIWGCAHPLESVQGLLVGSAHRQVANLWLARVFNCWLELIFDKEHKYM